jgi:hypothetical protein
MEEIRYDCSTCSTYNPSLIGSEETPNRGEKFLLSNHKCSDDGNEISSCCTYDRGKDTNVGWPKMKNLYMLVMISQRH